MSKKILLLALLIPMLHYAIAQDYIVEGTTPDLHLSHTVTAKETWYSIGRTFNIAPKDVAAYNKLSINTPLAIGQRINVPLTAANFSQNGVQADGETFVPVYHVVQPKEWLYRISVNYNKVPVASLQKWNGIGKEGAKPGTKLIVGYLKMKGGNAALSAKVPEPAEEKRPAAETTAVVKNQVPVKNTDSKPVEAKPSAASAQPPASASSPSGKEGSYFKNLFEDTGKSSSGIAGIFKSTSGWNDGKYYALASNVPVGTIVKITYPSTNKSVYAKVLGELPDMKESAGLALRISDAAAYELGSADSKFSVSVKY